MSGPADPQSAGAAYWEPLWQEGRRYRTIDAAEADALRRRLGPGRDRPALDIGCGEGALTAQLHRLGYRTTGIDCAPTAVASARGNHPDLDFRVHDFGIDDPALLPHPAFTAITCRLVFRWVTDRDTFLSRVRDLLTPGGTFWVVTSVHDPAQGPPKPWDLSAEEADRLTTAWSGVHPTELTPSFHCYALRP
ncbi:class I SAM-dependent methyltransferase [Streptomyces flavofungini]|uniref:Class I SAM-dependent methyltransferase n=1 Tax=Streptomyces flavofungini TaxID=68200 RepID=A0ABS0X929_9ACTN|nr:class I SAM-dependent methyltransferase [Streptomyces flavofungini]MBJ3809714.1 class I SAM-dependent methyltransferase [Streptomyces flavofungini]